MIKVATFDHDLFRLSAIDAFVLADLDRLAYEYLNDKKGGDFQPTIAVGIRRLVERERIGEAMYWQCRLACRRCTVVAFLIARSRRARGIGRDTRPPRYSEGVQVDARESYSFPFRD